MNKLLVCLAALFVIAAFSVVADRDSTPWDWDEDGWMERKYEMVSALENFEYASSRERVLHVLNDSCLAARPGPLSTEMYADFRLRHYEHYTGRYYAKCQGYTQKSNGRWYWRNIWSVRWYPGENEPFMYRGGYFSDRYQFPVFPYVGNTE